MPLTVKDMLDAANAAVPRIAPAEAVALAAKPGVLVLDVRDAAEVKASGKAAGAMAVSRGLVEFRADPTSPAHDPAMKQAATILVYCASGGRSALVGKTLKDMSYGDVRNLGGFKDWVEAGGAVEPG
ncbi:rhodanese-like domain-containing protein [Falsiroseomonas stagni]|uniref:Rhodanese-related sulfurtransferase n=1 Tax=Falsiroseomonas stagni DSM 19981 TaxID=1123062 RepID=A0A1I4DUU3_9PROT|nr:rhodanese-like domain-containing protein [Falsiroseomonas stagni]SFK97334.1 Rhodanese-related sulfurtransferase [Falsiroseomonas stagni DSM 19981]